MHFCLCQLGWRQGVAPPKSTAHHRHMKRQPFLCNSCPRRGRRHCHRHCHLRCCCQLRLCPPLPSPLPLQLPIAVAVVLGHCRCGCRQPSLPPSLSRCHQPSLSPSPSPLPLAIAVSVTVSHRSCHCRRPSPSAITVAMLSAISESFCLGTARIVFNQLKQRMLTLFDFVCTVGGALIEAR